MDEFLKKKVGKLSASTIKGLLTGGATRDTLILKKAKERLYNKVMDKFSTCWTRHGLACEPEAFQYIAHEFRKQKPLLQSNVFIEINGYSGASPDVITKDAVMDIKSVKLSTFLAYKANNKDAIKAYGLQLQMQMMATKVDKGYLAIFLKKQGDFDNPEYQDYDFLNYGDNIFYIEVKKCEDKHKQIKEACIEANKIIEEVVKTLEKAKKITVGELTAIARNKEISPFNITKEYNELFCVEEHKEFYVTTNDIK